MHKRSSFFKAAGREFKEFFAFYFSYNKKKVVNFSVWFEKNKNRLIKFFLMKRGRYNRPFLHIATMTVLGVGVLIAPFLADTYPIFNSKASALDLNDPSAQKQSVQVDEDVFGTKVSEKPRDKIITYTVEKGDTLGTIAQKFGVSEDTIEWANDLNDSNISIGDELKILPVSGIAHKVESGDTVYTIAKKYEANPQAIVDWDFNDFANPETFSLVVGQILVVPDGVKPSEVPSAPRRAVQFAQGPVPVASGGFTFPMRGGLMQYFSWFHPGIDIATSYGAPIYAAHSGTVTRVSVGTYDTGYGNNVWISKGDGVESHYAHLSTVNVSVGQRVVGGSTVIGAEGSTGRSTGPHLQFEIRVNGSLVNPLNYVQ